MNPTSLAILCSIASVCSAVAQHVTTASVGVSTFEGLMHAKAGSAFDFVPPQTVRIGPYGEIEAVAETPSGDRSAATAEIGLGQGLTYATFGMSARLDVGPSPGDFADTGVLDALIEIRHADIHGRLVLRRTPYELAGASTVLAEIDVFDDGSIEMQGFAGASDIEVPIPYSASPALVPVRVRLRLESTVPLGRASARLDVELLPAGPQVDVLDLCSVSMPRSAYPLHVGANFAGGVDLHATRPQMLAVLIGFQRLTPTMPLPGQSCDLVMTPVLAIPLSSPVRLPPLGVTQPTSVYFQAVKLEPTSLPFELSDSFEVTFSP